MQSHDPEGYQEKYTQANPYPGNQIYIVSHTNIWLCITEDFQICMMGILW